MIHSVQHFVSYFAGVRRRTLNYVRAIPADQMDWSPKPGELTCGDLIRHLAAAERMFTTVALGGAWHYRGHDSVGARTLEETIAHLESAHAEATAALAKMSDADLEEPRPSLQGPPAKAWRWLMAMTEHEVHHRSQIATYLALMGVEPPQIYGLKIEDIIALTTT
ncbi:MAG: DinB family protein [Chloroflexi bacterium]|nr:DinB family protein [Chloroflexota bacterium]